MLPLSYRQQVMMGNERDSKIIIKIPSQKLTMTNHPAPDQAKCCSANWKLSPCLVPNRDAAKTCQSSWRMDLAYYLHILITRTTHSKSATKVLCHSVHAVYIYMNDCKYGIFSLVRSLLNSRQNLLDFVILYSNCFLTTSYHCSYAMLRQMSSLL